MARVILNPEDLLKAAAQYDRVARSYDGQAARLRRASVPTMPPGVGAAVIGSISRAANLTGTQSRFLAREADGLRGRAWWAQVADHGQLTDMFRYGFLGVRKNKDRPWWEDADERYRAIQHSIAGGYRSGRDAAGRGVRWTADQDAFWLALPIVPTSRDFRHGVVDWGSDTYGFVEMVAGMSSVASVVDPVGTIRRREEFESGIRYIGQNPVWFVKNLVDWQTYKEHGFERWAGKQAPDIVITLLTGGLGAISRVRSLTRGAQKASDVAKIERLKSARAAEEVKAASRWEEGAANRAYIATMERLAAEQAVTDARWASMKWWRARGELGEARSELAKVDAELTEASASHRRALAELRAQRHREVEAAAARAEMWEGATKAALKELGRYFGEDMIGRIVTNTAQATSKARE